MLDSYFSYYILSYFQQDKVIKSAQILHVLNGKKTPSMYYLVEVNHWHHGFAIEKLLKKNDLLLIIRTALKNKWLIKADDGYLLTKAGEKTIANYFERHYYPQAIKCFKTIDLHQPFWSAFQLFTQVFSESAYQNKDYTAIIKDPRDQEKIRQLLEANQGKTGELFKQWLAEQKWLFDHLSTTQANSLANLLTGHQLVGKTRAQLAAELNMSLYEFNFYLRDILEEILTLITNNADNLSILFRLTKQIERENFMSLSESTFHTYQLLKEDKKISEIAKLRRLKESTIKEHLLELAFVLDELPIQKFLPVGLYENLVQQFQKKRNYSYQEALTDNKNLEFYHYRLVELERMRQQ